MKPAALFAVVASAAVITAAACGTVIVGASGSGSGGSLTTSTTSTTSSGGDAGLDGDGCVPLTCADQGFDCGMANDGCGGMIDCGGCSSPCYVCGEGCNSTPNRCQLPDCNPTTCASMGLNCGMVTNDCGSCTPPDSCGGGGKPNVCGHDCIPKTCAELGCDVHGDGCGGIIDCGTCPAPQTCGGGGSLGACGTPDAGADACAPKDCAQLKFNCGLAGDGCGNLLNCSTCVPGKTCGGGGMPNVCGP
jgi:hypothetical protein